MAFMIPFIIVILDHLGVRYKVGRKTCPRNSTKLGVTQDRAISNLVQNTCAFLGLKSYFHDIVLILSKFMKFIPCGLFLFSENNTSSSEYNQRDTATHAALLELEAL